MTTLLINALSLLFSCVAIDFFLLCHDRLLLLLVVVNGRSASSLLLFDASNGVDGFFDTLAELVLCC
jgi:hypothetical protein